MTHSDDARPEIAALRERIAARHGVITVVNKAGKLPDFVFFCRAAACWTRPGLEDSSGEMPARSVASWHSRGRAGLPVSGRLG